MKHRKATSKHPKQQDSSKIKKKATDSKQKLKPFVFHWFHPFSVFTNKKIKLLKLFCLSFGTLGLLSLLLIQFFNIQIVEGEKWLKQANIQHRFTIADPAKRGIFYGNALSNSHQLKEDQPLVIDVPKFHLYVDPLSIRLENRATFENELSHLLGLLQLQHQLSMHLKKRSRSRRVLAKIDYDQKEAIENWWKQFYKKQRLPSNALYFEKLYQRSYPFTNLAGQLLHTIQENRGDVTARWKPTGGLELFFNSLLQGQDGKRALLRSPRNPLDRGKIVQRPKHGADVYLTLNHVLQTICEQEIARAVEFSKAKRGWAVLMNPKNGEILAMAHYPFFNPEQTNAFFNDPQKMEETKTRAATDLFEPGSTMKPLSMTIALIANEEKKKQGQSLIFNPEEMAKTDNGRVPHRGKPLKDVRTYKYLDMDMAIQKSSNIYLGKLVYKIVETFGEEWYRKHLTDTFGFGEKTHIELPGEAQGMIPKKGLYYANGHPQWSGSTPYSLAFGYNLMVNSLQLVRAYSVLANGGYLVKPTLVRKIVQDGTPIGGVNPALPKKVLDPKVCDRIIRALKFSTKPGGSGFRGDVPGYTEVGKTGTTEKLIHGGYSKHHHFSSFVGFAPAKDAQFVLFVGIDEPPYEYIPGVGKIFFGGLCAAPAFSRIMKRCLEYMGVPPDDPHGYPSKDPRFDALKADWYPEVKKLRKKYLEYNNW